MNHTNAREVAELVAKAISTNAASEITSKVIAHFNMELDAKQRQRLADEDNAIFNDEEAMDMIRLLQDKGYEPDEVYQAMKEGGA